MPCQDSQGRTDAGFGGEATGKTCKKVRFDLPDQKETTTTLPAECGVAQSEAIAQALGRHSPVQVSSIFALLQISGNQLRPWVFGADGLSDESTQEGIRAARIRPCLVQLLCKALRFHHPSLPFAAIRVTCHRNQVCRRDLTCAANSQNLLLPLSSFQGGHLWLEDEHAPDDVAIFRQVPEDPKGQLRRGRIRSVRPHLAIDARRYHEVQEARGSRWVPEGFTPCDWFRLLPEDYAFLQGLGFPLPPFPDLHLPPPAVRTMAFSTDAFGNTADPAYECVGAARALQQCRISVKRVLDGIQDNLKRWVHEVKAFWGVANAQGEGEAPAELLRDTELQICSLQSTLEQAKVLEDQEDPPLTPTDLVKELASFYSEPTLPERVSVAHAQEDSTSVGALGQEVPLQTRTLTLAEVLVELEEWKPSWSEEYSSLVKTHQAVSPLQGTELQNWRSQGKKFQVIPSKLVHTLKAHTGRRKTRCVCCGNMEEVALFNRNECYAGGVDATALRAVLRVTAAWEWAISSFDVKTAFLQSRLLDKARRSYRS